jgi:hypothetical protein
MKLMEIANTGAYIACPDHNHLFHITDVDTASHLIAKLKQSLPPFEFNLLMEFPGVSITDNRPNGDINSAGDLQVSSITFKELLFKIKDWYNEQEYVMSGNFGMQNDSNHQDA